MPSTKSSSSAPLPVLSGEVELGDHGDSYVRKYSSVGTVLWTDQFGVANVSDRATAVATDSAGNVYVGGQTSGAFPSATSQGPRDAYVRKYSTGGVVQFTTQFGTSGWDHIYGIGIDGSFNIYVAGSTDGAMTGAAPSYNQDVYVRKYASDGTTVVWTRQLDSGDHDLLGNHVAVQPNGEIYIAGRTYGTMPGEIPMNGQEDAFIAHYNSAGDRTWIHQFGSTAADSIGGVAVRADGSRIVAVGYTWGAFPGAVVESGALSDDGFIASFHPPATTPVDLGLETFEVSDPVENGQFFGYSISVSNAGPGIATGVTITDLLPAGIDFRFSSASQAGPCVETATTVTCDVGTLQPGAFASMFVGGDAASTTPTTTNNASVTSAQTDTDLSDNTTSETTSVVTADLSITKTASPITATISSNLTYTLTVTNAGPDTAADVTVSDVLAGGVVFVSAGAGCSESGGTVTCTAASLANSASAAYTITVTAPGATGTISNTASVTSSALDLNASNDSVTLVTTVSDDADLSITKTATPTIALIGEDFTYTLTATNNEPVAANIVTIIDPLPAGVVFVSADAGCVESGGTVTCSVSSLANGASAAFDIIVTPPVSLNTLVNTATVSAVSPSDLNTANNSVTLNTLVGVPRGVPGVSTRGVLFLATMLGIAAFLMRRRHAVPSSG
ncbi:MAG: SBBP repeat-containing protein [Chloroflexi bacterium]|nr:SBBP repeat-containing protein [Chloroflexota bacterium]MDA1175090.1 SBBP repeat-containing protein [Chloroflexota bacterium]